MRHVVRRLVPVFIAGAMVVGALANQSSASHSQSATAVNTQSPIKHVVIVYMENHSFDNVLGRYCYNAPRRDCDGAVTGKSFGKTRPLTAQPDIVPWVNHRGADQLNAIHGGMMDGWSRINGCDTIVSHPLLLERKYGCYVQVARPRLEIPNLTTLADRFTVSDRTFQLDDIASWGAHMELASATLDGFTEDPGANPAKSTYTSKSGFGWGCDSFRDVWWGSGAAKQLVPACIPDQAGRGPYRASPVGAVPTIMDRFDAAHRSWRIYHPSASSPWAICSTFYSCLGSKQKNNVTNGRRFAADAAAKRLPDLSILIPSSGSSQHNNQSMIAGDNWIGQQIAAVMASPEWRSTAIFITYDDCGCFYDHVAPPAGFGLRVPMVIVSPYAKRGHTDHHVASILSMLTFTEHVFGLAPLTAADRDGYDFADSFNFSQRPQTGVAFTSQNIPQWERQWLADHPFDEDAEENLT
jgi:phospholipase C